jgi:predicted Zn-ribbon and HTH transcriptional regulator
MVPVKVKATKQCRQCGSDFYWVLQSAKQWEEAAFCSRACASRWRVRGHVARTKPCEMCGQEIVFPTGYSQAQWDERRYCGTACRRKALDKAAMERRPDCACGCGKKAGRAGREFYPGHAKRVGAVTRERFNPRTRRWQVFDGAKWRLRYRVLMEQHLGRPLSTSEVVHHKNGDSTDDRIENLEVFSSNAEHIHVGHSQEPAPCAKCGKPAKPLRRGKCQRCYDYGRRH